MTGVFVIARLGSTRLFQKHLIEVGGKTLIEWLIERFSRAFNTEVVNGELKIFIVTSDKIENKKFELIFDQSNGINIFYGSDSNIPLRQMQCAETYNISEIISVDGDDILSSTHAAGIVREKLINGVQFAKTSGLPLGMNIMGYQKQFLEKSLLQQNNVVLETGWGRIFNDEFLVNIPLGDYDADKRLRLTLDYEEDAALFTSIIQTLGEQVLTIDDKSLAEFIIVNRLYEINQHANEKYWQNFELQKKAES